MSRILWAVGGLGLCVLLGGCPPPGGPLGPPPGPERVFGPGPVLRPRPVVVVPLARPAARVGEPPPRPLPPRP